jgi:hypothetical protein
VGVARRPHDPPKSRVLALLRTCCFARAVTCHVLALPRSPVLVLPRPSWISGSDKLVPSAFCYVLRHHLWHTLSLRLTLCALLYSPMTCPLLFKVCILLCDSCLSVPFSNLACLAPTIMVVSLCFVSFVLYSPCGSRAVPRAMSVTFERAQSTPWCITEGAYIYLSYLGFLFIPLGLGKASCLPLLNRYVSGCLSLTRQPAAFGSTRPIVLPSGLCYSLYTTATCTYETEIYLRTSICAMNGQPTVVVSLPFPVTSHVHP